MPVKKRNPRNETVGITVSAEAKELIEEQAQLYNESVSEFLRPGVILSLVQHYMGITLEEAIERLIQNELPFEDIVLWLNDGDERGGVYRPPISWLRQRDATE